jgi:hypothetical protein
MLDDAQGVQVVIKTGSALTHERVKAAFARMAKWRMANIVNQRERLSEIRIQTKRLRHGTRYLGDLEGVRQAIAKVIRISGGEDLRFRFEAAKGARMNDAIAVAGIFPAIWVRLFGMAPAA